MKEIIMVESPYTMEQQKYFTFVDYNINDLDESDQRMSINWEYFFIPLTFRTEHCL